jgi:hypothetical protein
MINLHVHLSSRLLKRIEGAVVTLRTESQMTFPYSVIDFIFVLSTMIHVSMKAYKRGKGYIKFVINGTGTRNI